MLKRLPRTHQDEAAFRNLKDPDTAPNPRNSHLHHVKASDGRLHEGPPSAVAFGINSRWRVESAFSPKFEAFRRWSAAECQLTSAAQRPAETGPRVLSQIQAGLEAYWQRKKKDCLSGRPAFSPQLAAFLIRSRVRAGLPHESLRQLQAFLSNHPDRVISSWW
ncbi:hypothetical protein L596_000917 [Steinernema carpocapsae]|uniref:Uncharacterized protein n=1 Tax=Steinernema carpocapsae TaxID=34508 RepID=A0A4V6I6Z4_STECR|nr:hypothetical protein L596_000917 [Steinernema carpocapsae]